MTKKTPEFRSAAIGVVALAIGLAGCQVSVTTGLVGGLLTLALAWIVVAWSGRGGSAEAQPVISPCLSPMPPPMDAGAPPTAAPDPPPSASPETDPRVGPCLSPLSPDDFRLGPCLSVKPPPPAPDAGVPSEILHPCLSIAPPPKKPKAPPTESPLQICLSDIDVGPCLKMAPDPEDGGAQRTPPDGLDQAAVLARVLDRLPADVAARLRKDRDS